MQSCTFLFTYLHTRTYLLTQGSRVRLGKLTGSQLVKQMRHLMEPDGSLPRLPLPVLSLV